MASPADAFDHQQLLRRHFAHIDDASDIAERAIDDEEAFEIFGVRMQDVFEIIGKVVA